ncbi:MAG: Gfo/Idh/MocA family oxidoreductase [Opitutae bacterium]|nr:Gfo/Idh/MocA family oxidoreductase [Opitutae bacterium]
MNNSDNKTRRGFVKACALVTGAPFVSRLSWAAGSPMQKLQYAGIGLGGRGMFDVQSISKHEKVKMIAGADVDSATAKKLEVRMEGVKTFSDWREMFEIMGKDIDVVSVSTPDHMHGIMAMSAMNLGKHVYVQKPLAQTIGECRTMQATARRNKVIVQMGTQGASSFYDRMAVDLVQRKLIGKITEAWVFCGKSWGDKNPLPDREDPIPDGLDWDGWLGVGEKRPYMKKYYHPKNWRKRQGFGTGTLGDMGCHIFNSMYRGLALTAPKRVRSQTAVPNEHNWTSNERVEYEFPGTPFTDGDLKVFWISGRQRAPEELTALIPNDVKFRFGCLLKGEEGVLLLRHGNAPMLLPIEKYQGVRPKKMKAIGHHNAFIDAILDGDRSRLLSPIDFAAPMTESILLGNVAMQNSPDWLEWDAANLDFTNNDKANASVKRTYRSGWEIMGV